MAEKKYKEEYCELLIKHMKMGKSFDSFPSSIYAYDKQIVGLQTLYDWANKYEEFREAKQLAFQEALSYFETRAFAKTSGQKIDGINAKDIDAYVLMGMLKTRFHKIYGDKVQHDVANDIKGISISITKEEENL